MTQSNKFILQHFQGISIVGLMGVGYNLTFPLLMTIFAIIPIAAFPRIINLYVEKQDVRPIISKLTEYFMLISLPIIVIGSFYSKEIVLFFAHQRFMDAYVLLPYLGFSAFFLSLSEYTTMQYHLINKTHIDTIIKVTSGVIGVILNIIFIPPLGLVGVGIATLFANILYFLLSIIIVIPNLEWQVPYHKICQILISFLPVYGLYEIIQNQNGHTKSIYEIIILMSIYYLIFWCLNKFCKIKKEAT